MSKNMICFGEVLWDVFPQGKKIGGAPLNVALRLSALGLQTTLVSKVGKDDLGEELLDFVEQSGLKIDHIQQTNQFDTGKVIVTLDAKGSASYDIAQPAAWDKITVRAELLEAVQKCNLFLFGSLATRDEVTKQTLFQLLTIASFKVFDVNLRPPHYTYDLLDDLMKAANFIKFNDEELTEISQEMGCASSQVENQIKHIAKHSNTHNICVTRGSEGALLYLAGTFYTQKGFPIEVADTVGAGDSFLATLLEGILTKRRPEESLERACAMGALVASKQGANPKITEKELIDFIQNSA